MLRDLLKTTLLKDQPQDLNWLHSVMVQKNINSKLRVPASSDRGAYYPQGTILCSDGGDTGLVTGPYSIGGVGSQ